MKNINKIYSFVLHTQYPIEALLNLKCLSENFEIPMNNKKVILSEDKISFEYLMDETTAEMIIRIIFQQPGFIKIELLKGKIRQTLRNPFELTDETEI